MPAISNSTAFAGMTPGAPIPGAPPGPPGPSGAGQLPPGFPPAGLPGAMTGPINPFIYTPSFSMTVTASITFLLLAFASTKQLIRTKAWYFNLMPQAALIGAAGMIARTHAVLNIGNMGAFAAAMFATQIPPSLVVFGNFFTFTRIMWWITPEAELHTGTMMLPPKQMSLIWGGIYMVGEIAKAIGTNMRTNPIAHRAQEIGIIYQMFCLALFSGFVCRYMRVSRSWDVPYDAVLRGWRGLGWTVCAVSAILTIRNLYLIVEFDGQPTGMPGPEGMAYVATHEWAFWLGNAIPLALSLLLYSINHPGDYLPHGYTRLRWKIADIESLRRSAIRQSPPQPISAVSSLDKGATTIIEEISMDHRR